MKIEHLTRWDKYGMEKAKLAATMSKDPSTQVGAYICDMLNRPVSEGFNGFPRGVHDTPERLHDRAQKYPRMVHAELNAILNAPVGIPPGSTLYVYGFVPCANCAGAIIQSGIKRVFSLTTAKDRVSYDDSYGIMKSMFNEADVSLFELE